MSMIFAFFQTNGCSDRLNNTTAISAVFSAHISSSTAKTGVLLSTMISFPAGIISLTKSNKPDIMDNTRYAIDLFLLKFIDKLCRETGNVLRKPQAPTFLAIQMARPVRCNRLINRPSFFSRNHCRSAK